MTEPTLPAPRADEGTAVSKRKCVVCGVDPAAGFASIGDGFYCHGDDDQTPTCYERSQHLLLPALCADSKAASTDPLASLSLDDLLDALQRTNMAVPFPGEPGFIELRRRFLLLQQEKDEAVAALGVGAHKTIRVLKQELDVAVDFRIAADRRADAAERERDEARERLVMETHWNERGDAAIEALAIAERDLAAARVEIARLVTVNAEDRAARFAELAAAREALRYVLPVLDNHSESAARVRAALGGDQKEGNDE